MSYLRQPPPFSLLFPLVLFLLLPFAGHHYLDYPYIHLLQIVLRSSLMYPISQLQHSKIIRSLVTHTTPPSFPEPYSDMEIARFKSRTIPHAIHQLTRNLEVFKPLGSLSMHGRSRLINPLPMQAFFESGGQAGSLCRMLLLSAAPLLCGV